MFISTDLFKAILTAIQEYIEQFDEIMESIETITQDSYNENNIDHSNHLIYKINITIKNPSNNTVQMGTQSIEKKFIIKNLLSKLLLHTLIRNTSHAIGLTLNIANIITKNVKKFEKLIFGLLHRQESIFNRYQTSKLVLIRILENNKILDDHHIPVRIKKSTQTDQQDSEY
ncbi:hypothetical protein KC865_04830 [Candidatus Kaiserbacteria bacterium]|nr:hypothetical protein [Candidatus Kaiserbacteria bacterium]